MNIQWFPGHMLETQNLLQKSAAKVDAILEVLDARVPRASENPLVEKLCKNKFRLKILNKADLADPDITTLWLAYFKNQKKMSAIAITATDKALASRVLTYCGDHLHRNRARKRKLLVVGIPNTGKSTLLNTLAGKKIARTGNVPAITRHQQRTSLKNNIDIYDTPGILWPVITPRQRAYALAVSGAISDTAVDYQDIAFFAAGFLLQRYPELLLSRYRFLDALPGDETELIERIGAARGCLKPGGLINYQKAGEILIRDLRAGKIGRISIETPYDEEKNGEKDPFL
ncbi:MAG TPA: ribosome biogenesis GTPase YlqF [Desulfotignum sp.]|nr:ribosome biogenesis GTPase YlqF [Desulfotignum sp.]